ncbi:hypothetical protein ACIHFE_33155 [Streptomyces sp. NPDC052396]
MTGATAQQKTGQVRVTVYRAVATMRNAPNTAVRSWRLRHNAEH